MPQEQNPAEGRQDSLDQEVKILYIGDLGPGNQGEFGPGSEREQEACKDAGDERYWGPRQEKSACMDDRLEGLRLHLAGNRAVTEVAGDYADSEADELPISRAMPRKIQELTAIGRPPVFHRKCAALGAVRSSLGYNAEHEDEIVAELWKKLESVGATRYLTEQQAREAIKVGKSRHDNDDLWDAAPEQLMESAEENGAEIEDAAGDHHVAGNLDNMSGLGFNNGLFKSEHTADDGEPMGMLTIDWAGYHEQLLEDGFSEAEAARKLMLGGLFIIAVQKMINKDGSPVVAVGAAI